MCGGASGEMRPIVWTAELGIVTLRLPPGAIRGSANDINNVLGSDGFGQVACTLSFGIMGGNRACLYDDGEWSVLHPVGDGLTEAYAIYDAGWIAGYRDHGEQRFAVRWRGAEIEEIDSPIAGRAIARGINADAIVGGFGSLVTNGVGFLWQKEQAELMPLLPGVLTADARAINQFYSVVGRALMPEKGGIAPGRSWIYAGGELIDFGSVEGAFSNRVEAVNDVGQAVGACFTIGGGSKKYLWQDGELILLSELLDFPPGIGGFGAVNAINNRGQIAGHSGGSARGIILTPVDRPLGDVNIDCAVDADDLMMLLGHWGPCR